ncbi:MAG: hypothetical protein WB679_24825 [Terracidiphilus sp.]
MGVEIHSIDARNQPLCVAAIVFVLGSKCSAVSRFFNMESMRESMEIYPRTAAERAMKLHEVLLRASAAKIKWWQAAELMGIRDLHAAISG